MAVPASGTANLSLRAIRDELSNNNYGGTATFSNISLEDCSDGTVSGINAGNASSNRPDESAPHAMSEFYSYDHDAVALGPPTSVSYTALSTSTFRITFTENAASTRVYIYQDGANAINGTNGVDNGFIKNANNDFITVDGSGTTNVTIGDASGATDTYFTGGSTGTISLGANDYINFYLKSHDGSSTFSGESSGVQGWTLPGTPGNLAASSVDESSMTISWDAPTGGVNGSNGYRLYFGTDSTVTDNTAYDQGGTSKSFTGLSADTTHYFAVKAKNGGGDFGAITGTENQDTAEDTSTVFDPGIADYTMTKTEGGSTVTNASTMVIKNGSGNLTGVVSGVSSAAIHKISLSATGDPGATGTNNSATGYGSEDQVPVLSGVSWQAGGTTIYVRVSTKGGAHRDTGDTWTITFTNNSVSDAVTITDVFNL